MGYLLKALAPDLVACIALRVRAKRRYPASKEARGKGGKKTRRETKGYPKGWLGEGGLHTESDSTHTDGISRD